MRRHGVDSYGNKQEMLTLIQAYWDIASRRFIDNLCMNIEKYLIHQLIDEITTQCTLYGISVDEKGILDLLKEDEYIFQQRQDIAKRLKVLESALDILNSYMSTYGL
jgi:interferon-induced GTP-binding protein Mx1